VEAAVVEKPRSKRAGLISFGDGPEVVCTLRSISAFGAALHVSAYQHVPDEFILTVTPDGRDRRRCIVIWRKRERLAVAFY
jgi:hypothetical protein